MTTGHLPTRTSQGKRQAHVTPTRSYIPLHVCGSYCVRCRNTCVNNGGKYYSGAFSKCSADPNNLNATVYGTSYNSLLADGGGNFTQTCNQTLSWAQWQALGQDVGSILGATPSVQDLIAMGAAKVLGQVGS